MNLKRIADEANRPDNFSIAESSFFFTVNHNGRRIYAVPLHRT